MENTQIIAKAIWQVQFITDKNKIREQAKQKALRSVAAGIIGQLQGTKNFDEKEFLKACGFNF